MLLFHLVPTLLRSRTQKERKEQPTDPFSSVVSLRIPCGSPQHQEHSEETVLATCRIRGAGRATELERFRV